MANTYASEVTGLGTTPLGNAEGAVQGGRIRRFRATVELSEQASGDTVTLAKVPAGYAFSYGVLTTSTSLSTSTIAVGVEGEAAKYKAAATFTSTDTPTTFGKAAAIAGDPLTDGEDVLLTVGSAALPSSGTLVVDLFYSAP